MAVSATGAPPDRQLCYRHERGAGPRHHTPAGRARHEADLRTLETTNLQAVRAATRAICLQGTCACRPRSRPVLPVLPVDHDVCPGQATACCGGAGGRAARQALPPYRCTSPRALVPSGPGLSRGGAAPVSILSDRPPRGRCPPAVLTSTCHARSRPPAPPPAQTPLRNRRACAPPHHPAGDRTHPRAEATCAGCGPQTSAGCHRTCRSRGTRTRRSSGSTPAHRRSAALRRCRAPVTRARDDPMCRR